MAVAAVAVVAGVLALVSPARAHGGGGAIEVGEAEVVDARTVEFPIRITYTGDGHPAEEVEGLVVSGKGPDGAELAPVAAFSPGDAPGVFRARVELPVEGAWELRIEVAEPEASATLTADTSAAVSAPVDDPTEPPDAPDVTIDGADTSTDDAAGDGDGATPEDLGGAVDADDAAGAEDDDDGSATPLLIASVVVIGLIIAGVVVVNRRRSV